MGALRRAASANSFTPSVAMISASSCVIDWGTSRPMQWKDLLTLDVQAYARGHQHRDARSNCQQVGQKMQGCLTDQMLEVIQHE